MKSLNDEGSTHCVDTEVQEPIKSLELEETAKMGSRESGKPSVIPTKAIINSAIDSNVAITLMSFITIYAIFGDDVRILAFGPGADKAFLTLSTLAFASFFLEILLLCWCRESYLQMPDFAAIKEVLTADRRSRKSLSHWLRKLGKAMQTGSFYFWLDLMSTCSMAIEMPWILPPGGNVADSLESTIAGKASVAGARAANKLKVIRMMRLVRLAKLYKYFTTKQKSKARDLAENNGEDTNILDKMPPESHVGAEMSDRTTKRVIVGILVMLLGIPLLQADEIDYFNELSMTMAFENRQLLSNGVHTDELEQWEFSESLLVNRTSCIDITYEGFDDGIPDGAVIPSDRPRVQELRAEEMDLITIRDIDRTRSMTAIFDASERKREEAIFGVLLTSFVIVLLCLGMLSFTKDVRNLVIVPIERMIQLVREISENPLGKDLSLKIDDRNHKDDGMETTLLIRTISKIAGLMRVGFGEAGADIIGKNLNITQGTDTMNLLGTGRKIHSIFGFCDVRQFTDTTECLQEEIMLFVNRIAHILHSIVVQCDGAANKNIGDAFLLTWKVSTDKLNGSCKEQNYSGDKALYSFVKTMIEMRRHEDFLCKFSPRALSDLYERMPGYKCRIGCGLHFGWAIEGAIGSSRKIDASYISPHVNMSETLECATKEYGTSILMSEPFYRLLSPEATSGCRKVDTIKKRGSDRATGRYTYDVDLDVGFALPNKAKKVKTRLAHHRKTRFTLLDQNSDEVSSLCK